MSVIVASGETISKHLQNKSISKQMYSFPKAQRFYNPLSREGSSTFYYNLPAVTMKRSSSIGYGHKYDFTKGKASAPYYNLKRMFEGKPTLEPRAPAFSFGLGREFFGKTVVEGETSLPEKVAPGPGKYDTSVAFGTLSPKYSMRKRTMPISLSLNSRNPGPSNYTPIAFTSVGKYPVSQLKNSTMVGWSLSKDKRFKKEFPDTPGPNAYASEILLNGKGDIYNAKYKSCLGKSFLGKYDRSRNKSGAEPGPGSYTTFSEFGIYESKNASDIDRKRINATEVTSRKNYKKSASCEDITGRDNDGATIS